MKKILSWLVTFTMIFVLFTGCATTEKIDNTPSGSQTPGLDNSDRDQQDIDNQSDETVKDAIDTESDVETYTSMEKEYDENGWRAVLTIKVKDGKVFDVVYDEVNRDGVMKGEDTEYRAALKDANDIDIVEAFQTLQRDLIDKQDPEKVDAYTGATGTTNKFKALAMDAFAKANIQGYALEPGVETYTAEENEFDQDGWRAIVTVKVEDGKIIDAQYDEINKAGVLKSEATDYQGRFKDLKDIDVVEAYRTLKNGLLGKQDPEMVDTYTAATIASDKFRVLASKALSKSQVKEPISTIEIYTAEEPDYNEEGWKAKVTIQVRDGRIIDAEYDEINQEGKTIRNDEFNDKIEDIQNIDVIEDYDYLENGLIDKQNPQNLKPSKVPEVTYNRFKNLAQEAYDKVGQEEPESTIEAYTAKEKNFDEYGWKGVLTIKLKDGILIDTAYNEISREGKMKTEDVEYVEQFQTVNDISILEAYETLQNELKEKQDPAALQAYMDNQEIYQKFKSLAIEAFKKAK